MAIPRNTSSAMAIFILLLVFISELLWSTSEALTQECHVPEVTDGQTGMMVFFIDRRVNFSSDHFFANLIRSDEPDWDILNCDQPNRTSHVSCKINSPIYKCRGVRDHTLTVFIPNITQHYADTYVFQVYINSIAQPPVFCSVSVKKQLKPHINTVIKTESTTTPWVIAGVIFLAIGSLTLVLFVVVFHRQRICGSCSNDDETSRPRLLNGEGASDVLLREHSSQTSNNRVICGSCSNDDETSRPRLLNKSLDVSKATRTSKSSPPPAELPEWVFRNMSDKEAKERLLSEGKDDFTFLVRTDKKQMFISVRFDPYSAENYQIRHDVKGYWIEPHHGFVELSDLVVHYRKIKDFFGHTLGNRIDAKL